ncbi:MAG: heme NO-binding domain-containing protein [Panacagrimonas sp.]
MRKLYPQAELPGFSYPHRDDATLVMEYRSPRPLAAFATGLVRSAIAHFGEPIQFDVRDLSAGQGTAARYTLTRTRA